MKRVKQLFTSTVLVILFFGISKVTGLIRGNLVAGRFGIGGEFDAFTAANQLPELFFVLIAGGALAAAFIPVYSNYLTDQRQKEAAELLHSTLTLRGFSNFHDQFGVQRGLSGASRPDTLFTRLRNER